MRRSVGAALFLSLAAAPLRAQTAPASTDAGVGLDASERLTLGRKRYFDDDAALRVGLPYGIDGRVEFNGYRTDVSSFTPIVVVGAGKEFDDMSVRASYTLQGRANNFESNAVDAGLTMHSDSEEYRTEFGADMAVKHTTNILVPLPVTFNLTMLVPSAALEQKAGPWRFSVGLSQYNYNADVAGLSSIPFYKFIFSLIGYNPNNPQYSYAQVDGLNGLIGGFPNWSAKYGVAYDFASAPLTLWASYYNAHMLDTGFSTHTTVDATAAGADFKLGEAYTAALRLTHFRETGQPITRMLGLSLAARF